MQNRFAVLDGWRGISIVLVLAGHLLPLGFGVWNINGPVAASGMAIFFILSGFLITNILLKDDNIKRFLIRRVFRIFPLAWLVLFILFIFRDSTSHEILSNLFFYANWPPIGLTELNGHFWSLSVEVQFYVAIAVLILLLGKKGFYFIPLFCLFITAFRMYHGVEMSINTYFRVDEILAGCVLALVYFSKLDQLKQIISSLNPLLLFILLILSGHSQFEYLNYLRPYIALLMVGSTLFASETTKGYRLLTNSFLVYLATVSYALYIIHGVLMHTWLGDGETLEKYLKRPLLVGLTFVLAHISTFYYEKYWIKFAKKITT